MFWGDLEPKTLTASNREGQKASLFIFIKIGALTRQLYEGRKLAHPIRNRNSTFVWHKRAVLVSLHQF